MGSRSGRDRRPAPFSPITMRDTPSLTNDPRRRSGPIPFSCPAPHGSTPVAWMLQMIPLSGPSTRRTINTPAVAAGSQAQAPGPF